MQTYFYELADYLQQSTKADEVSLVNLSAEDSTFVRFNKNAVRQAGSVKQSLLTITLIAAQRRAESRITLTGDADTDKKLCATSLDALRATIAELPEDPYLLYNTTPQSSEHISKGALPTDDQMLSEIISNGNGRDLVGIYAAGAMMKGFANSLGQRNWHHVDNFNFDWCLYHTADKAVKNSYAGTHWNSGEFAEKMRSSVTQLDILKRPPKTLVPGLYRACLSPAALNEIMGLLAWGSFGAKAQRNKQSALMKLEDGSAKLSEAVTLSEASAAGVAPLFNADGYTKAASVALITQGRHAGALVSPRTAKEFSIATNGANAAESPESLDMAAGTLKREAMLSTLDSGLMIGNLWYLNYSDRATCRMTGMTRFATFWVEKGEIVAPVNVMRFDDSAYRVLGENLVGLSTERDWLLDAGSYGERSSGSARLPAAIVNDFQLTL
jgi:predicted Zn-dependent protease